MRKRFWAFLLAVMMVVSVLPTTSFAAYTREAGDLLSLEEGEVKATKALVSAESDEYGWYTIQLTAEGKPKAIKTPADVVLCIDVSNSMDTVVVEGACKGNISTQWDIRLVREGHWEEGHWVKKEHGGWKWIPARWVPAEYEYIVTGYTCDKCGKTWEADDVPPDVCDVVYGAGETLNRMDIARKAAVKMAEDLLDGEYDINMAVVAFGGAGNISEGKYTGGENDTYLSAEDLTDDKDVITTFIKALNTPKAATGNSAGGGTNYTSGLGKARDILNARTDKSRAAYVLFLSDGAPGASGLSANDSKWNGTAQAKTLQDAGVTIYTGGIAIVDGGNDALRAISSVKDGSVLYQTISSKNMAADLARLMADVTKAAKKAAGTNAVMTDVINTADFDFDAETAETQSGVTVSTDGKTVSWVIGEITESPKVITLKVKPKANKSGKLFTNEDVYLSYTDVDGKSVVIGKDKIGDPFVYLPCAELSIEKSVTSVSGSAPETDDSGNITTIAEVGDEIIWTITVTNSGDLHGGIELPADVLKYRDGNDNKDYIISDVTVKPAGGLEADGEGFYTVPVGTMDSDGETWIPGKIEFTAAYTVTENDYGRVLVNTVNTKDADGNTIEAEAPGIAVKNKELTFTFDANGGAWASAVEGYTMGADNKTASKGGYIFNDVLEKISTEPVREGYEFVGWYTYSVPTTEGQEAELTAKWWGNEGTTSEHEERIYEDTTVYAKWVKKEGPPAADDKTGTLYINLQDKNGAALGDLITISITEDWLVSETAGENVDYVIPAALTVGTDHYIYEEAVSGELSGTLSKDGQNVFVALQYTLDNWNDEKNVTDESDNIPDKYQALILYTVEDAAMGSVSLEREVVTIKDETYPIPSETGKIKIAGSEAAAAAGYVFSGWTSKESMSFTGSDAAALIGQTIHGVQSGKTYTFIAHFTEANPDLKLSKTVKSIGGVDVSNAAAEQLPLAAIGEQIVWTITVENSGNCTLYGITVDDVLKDEDGNILSGVSVFPIGTYGNIGDELAVPFTIRELPAGMSSAYEARYTVSSSDEGKVLSNSVSAEGAETGNAPGVTVMNAALSVKKVADKTSITVGNKVTYTITVSNTGNVALTDVAITEKFSGDFSEIFDVNGADKTDSGFDVGELKAGESRKISFSYNATKPETLTNFVVAQGTYAPDKTVKDEAYAENVTVYNEYVPPVVPVIPPRPELKKGDHVSYIIGYPDGGVHPDDAITRAEAATIFFRMLTDESRAEFWCQKNDFTDVSPDDWFNNAVSTMANAKIIEGYPDGSFRPNAPVSRAEFAAIAARFSDAVSDGVTDFFDVSDSHWAFTYIAKANELGWVKGDSGYFRPDDNMTRAEVITVVNRVLERAVHEEGMPDGMILWPDNQPGKWYYEAVQEATNSHTYVRTDEKVNDLDFFYEKWLELIKNPDWGALECTWSEANSK
ncbi:MAG: S-layer homology domain-containing protein [Clostridiales bacterium]|nr:S-layer homology domain-containing protein [Clostridiales bacterium]